MLAHKLLQKAAAVRKAKEILWMRPDGKSQVTVEYDGSTPVRISAVVFRSSMMRRMATGII